MAKAGRERAPGALAARLLLVGYAALAMPAFGEVGAGVGAGDMPPLLTLDQAIGLAIQGNNQLLAAAAEVGEAEAGLHEARAARMPRIELEELFSRTTNPTLVFSSLLNQESFGPGDFAINRLNEPDALNNVNSRLSISQRLWTGGRVKNSIAAAELARDASERSRERTRQEVVHQVIEAYTAAILAAAQLEVAGTAVETARAHVSFIRDLHQGGLVVESDLLQAQVRLSEMEELLILAESAVAVGQAEVNFALGRDAGTPFTLPGAMNGVGDGEAEIMEDLLEEAGRNRPDLQAARLVADAAGRNVQVQRAGRLPQIGVSGNFEANSEQALTADGTNWSIFAGARFTIFDGRTTGARIQRAEQQRLHATSRRDLLRQVVGLQVRRAFHDLRAARQRQHQAEQAVALAGASLRIVEDRYKEGLTLVVELLDAQMALTRARTRESAARRDIVVGRANLDLAMGRL